MLDWLHCSMKAVLNFVSFKIVCHPPARLTLDLCRWFSKLNFWLEPHWYPALDCDSSLSLFWAMLERRLLCKRCMVVGGCKYKEEVCRQYRVFGSQQHSESQNWHGKWGNWCWEIQHGYHTRREERDPWSFASGEDRLDIQLCWFCSSWNRAFYQEQLFLCLKTPYVVEFTR